ncbi:MAG: hypothetical protein PW843_01695 [Azospirillaceae bacterium]|nr:hypothetical protein [Azospirillaceae bacterium]
MEIHAPESPIHSLKEFAVHIGVVTIGILIALGLEQAVEAYHRHELAHEAVESFHAELKDNSDAISAVLADFADNDARAERDIALLTSPQAAEGELLKYPNLRLDLLSTASWDTAIATHALAEIPYAQVRAYTDAYNTVRLFMEEEKAQLADWQTLRVYGDAPAQIDPAQRQALVQRLRAYRNYVIVLNLAGKSALESIAKATGEAKGH